VFDDWVLVVWVGDFTGKSNPTFVGRKTAAPLFFRLADAIRAAVPCEIDHPEIPKKSLHLTQLDLCALTGDLASSHCAHTLKGWFIPGKSPLKICEVHQKICVNPLTGRRIPEYAATATTISKIMEVWPSEWRPLLARAGRCPPEPPEWEKTANVSDSAPEILSPPAHILRRENEPVSLLARGGRKDRPLRWFLDQTFLGSSTGDHPLLWEPRAGTHTLTVVDGDQTVTRRLTVE
jgi:penicillin-binding protein 1C